MSERNNKTLIDSERLQRRKVAIKLQEIAGNPLTQEDEEIFAMFDRKGWSFEQRADYIKEFAIKASAKSIKLRP